MFEILFLLWAIIVCILNPTKKTIILAIIAFVLGVISIQFIYQGMDLLDFEPNNQKAMTDNSIKFYSTFISAVCLLGYLSIIGVLKQFRKNK